MSAQTGNHPVRTEGASGQHAYCDSLIADLRAQLAERDAWLTRAAQELCAERDKITALREMCTGARVTARAGVVDIPGDLTAREGAPKAWDLSPAAVLAILDGAP